MQTYGISEIEADGALGLLGSGNGMIILDTDLEDERSLFRSVSFVEGMYDEYCKRSEIKLVVEEIRKALIDN